MDPKIHAAHGGAFFDAIGVDFQTLENRQSVISADVLDAWYDPAPAVLEKIQAHLAWLIKTSPPTHSEGLIEAISEARGIPETHLLLGSGTSSLMYITFPRIVNQGAKVLLLDPTYGEYGHIFDEVLRAEVIRCPLEAATGFVPDLDLLVELAQGVELIVLVNPNSPTGVAVSSSWLKQLLDRISPATRIWIDETYVDFAPAGTSLESWVTHDPRVIVAKSLSKYYALSGLRAGYLAADPSILDPLRPMSPPWAVGLLAQVAGVEALRSSAYYEAKAQETHRIRDDFGQALGRIEGLKVYPSTTNYFLVDLGRPAAPVWERLAARGVFVRDCSEISARFGGTFVRIAVKDSASQARMIDEIRKALD